MRTNRNAVTERDLIFCCLALGTSECNCRTAYRSHLGILLLIFLVSFSAVERVQQTGKNEIRTRCIRSIGARSLCCRAAATSRAVCAARDEEGPIRVLKSNSRNSLISSLIYRPLVLLHFRFRKIKSCSLLLFSVYRHSVDAFDSNSIQLSHLFDSNACGNNSHGSQSAIRSQRRDDLFGPAGWISLAALAVTRIPIEKRHNKIIIFRLFESHGTWLGFSKFRFHVNRESWLRCRSSETHVRQKTSFSTFSFLLLFSAFRFVSLIFRAMNDLF